MVKDSKTGEIFRADHLVEAVIEARLKGDKEARGVQEQPPAEDEGDKKKKKKKVKSVAVKLPDGEVAEYESLLAQVRSFSRQAAEGDAHGGRSTTTLDQSLAISYENTKSSTQKQGTR